MQVDLDAGRLACALRSAVAVVLFASLAGCGGGGGGGSSAPLAVAMSPNVIEQSFQQSFNPSYEVDPAPQVVAVHATFASPPPVVASVRLELPEAVFGADPVSFQATDNSSTDFIAVVTPDPTLKPGVHEGDAVLVLCRDQACTNRVPMTGNSVHYKFTVAASLQVTLLVDGVQFTSLGTAAPGTSNTEFFANVRSGGKEDLSSTLPVTWSVREGAIGSTSPCLFDTVTVTRSNETPTTLSLVVDNGMTTPCDLEVSATLIGSSQQPAVYALHVGLP